MVSGKPGCQRARWPRHATEPSWKRPVRALAAARVAALAALLACSIAALASAPWLGATDGDGATPPPAATRTYRCGDRVVTVNVTTTALELTLIGERLVLEHVPAASGAKYRDMHGNLFCSRGEHALLELRGQAYPECTRTGCDGVRCDRTPRASLSGMPWEIEDIGGRGIVDRSRVTLEFDDDGRLSGHASCNRFTASYTRDGDKLDIGPAAVTRMACPPALMNQERVFLDALARVRRFAIDDSGTLVLAGANGDERLVSARRP